MDHEHDQNPTHDLASPLNPRRAMLAGLGGLAAGAFLASTANAGPLTPPPGPIASTPGPEPRIAINATNTPGDADSLFKITQPGSYYLTGNITGVAGKHGIEIASSGVTIDLMGFEVTGIPGTIDGIRTSISNLRNIAILNGSVRNWGSTGINLFIFPATIGRVEAINSTSNGLFGIRTSDIFTIINCIATDNGDRGISAGGNCTIQNCTACNNDLGILASTGSLVTGCTSSTNSSTGVSVDFACTVTGCVVQSNGSGITALSGCAVSNCIVAFNAGHGIQMQSECLAKNNNCDANGTSGAGAGIRTLERDNRVEDNNCTDNRTGIECVTDGNFIARNTCSGNFLNWNIAANNACLVVTVTPSTAIVGSSGGTSPGSSNPYANFTY